jgi:predicted nucleic acid-binding protein
MRIFLDANILVSVLNKEYPLFTLSSRILSLADTKKFQIYTSPVCLAIAFYFAEKKYNSKTAKQKVSVLCDHIEVAENTILSVKKALNNPKINDFEDGLEYYSALENKCNCIITEDTEDFYFSEIEALSCYDFFMKYMAA